MLIRHALHLCAALAAALIIAGCAALPVEFDYNHDYAFRNLRNYAWLDTPLTQGSLAADNNAVDREVVHVINRRLAGRGFGETRLDSADFLLAYHVGSKNRILVSESGYYYRDWAQRFRNYRYHTGTLVLDVIDPASRALVWRGWSTGVVELGPEKMERRIEEAVDKLLANFPPGQAL